MHFHSLFLLKYASFTNQMQITVLITNFMGIMYSCALSSLQNLAFELIFKTHVIIFLLSRITTIKGVNWKVCLVKSLLSEQWTFICSASVSWVMEIILCTLMPCTKCSEFAIVHVCYKCLKTHRRYDKRIVSAFSFFEYLEADHILSFDHTPSLPTSAAQIQATKLISELWLYESSLRSLVFSVWVIRKIIFWLARLTISKWILSPIVKFKSWSFRAFYS